MACFLQPNLNGGLLPLIRNEGENGMTVKIAKLFIGASVALSLSAFALPVRASYTPVEAPAGQSSSVSKSPVLVQYAQEEEHHELKNKVEGTINEGENEVRGAKDAVKAQHEAHEANESMHEGVADKTESQVDELKDEARDAKNAVKAQHRAHEAAEGER